jgi:serine/threonine protein phosphatase PrpC
MSIYSISKKGIRDQNEDKDTIIVNLSNQNNNIAKINIYGVYDGHGGKFVSKYISENLPKYFLNKNIVFPLSGKYIKETFARIQQKLETEHSTESDFCGSTCLMAFEYIYDKKRYVDVVNLGDSRCLISRNNIANVITKDHKPNWPDEKKRLEQIGGQIYYDGADWRIGALSVSRAFGDLDTKPYISTKPDIFRYKITRKDQFMIMACDGLWDVIDNQEAVNFVISQCYDLEGNRINKKTNIARMLADLALQKGSTDNITAIIIFFK